MINFIREGISTFPKRLIYILILATVGILSFTFVRTYRDMKRYGGNDLRARVVGARALAQGRNPYTYRQDNATDPVLFDPFRICAGWTRATYPPTVLALYLPLQKMSYFDLRRIYWFIEWAFFLFLIAVFIFKTPVPDRPKLAFLLILFFGASYFWRLHLERGQYYVVAAACWGVAMVSAQDGSKKPKTSAPVWIAISLGLAGLLRPTNFPFLFLAVLGWLGVRSALWFGLTFSVPFLLTIHQWGISLWREFFMMGKAYGLDVAQPGYLVKNFGEPVVTAYATVENVDLNAYMTSLTRNTSWVESWRRWGWFDENFPEQAMHANQLFFGMLLILFLFFTGRRLLSRAKPDRIHAVFLATAFSYLTDFFVPIRQGYADILFLPLFALLFWERRQSYYHRMAFLTAGLGLALSLTPYNGRALLWNGEIETMIRAALLSISLVLYSWGAFCSTRAMGKKAISYA